MRKLLIIGASLLLTSCASYDAGKDAVYGYVAKKGNAYCVDRDDELRDAALNRVNENLRENGATFKIKGIDCEAYSE